MSQFAAKFESLLPTTKRPLLLWLLALLMFTPAALANETWELEQRSPYNETIQQASPLTLTPLTKPTSPGSCALWCRILKTPIG